MTRPNKNIPRNCEKCKTPCGNAGHPVTVNSCRSFSDKERNKANNRNRPRAIDKRNVTMFDRREGIKK